MTEELMKRSICVVITIWYPPGLPWGRVGRVGNESFIFSLHQLECIPDPEVRVSTLQFQQRSGHFICAH